MAERLTDKRLIEIRTWLLCKKSQTDYSVAPEVPLELLDEIDALRSENARQQEEIAMWQQKEIERLKRALETGKVSR